MFVSNISLQRRRDDIDLDEYRRHWLDPHGPMTAKLPGTRFYVQNHVLFTAGTNALARQLGIDGFAQLAFDTLEARAAAYNSPELKACNLNSPLFLGRVSRVVTESKGAQPSNDEDLTKAIAVVPRLASTKGATPGVGEVLKHFPSVREYTEHRILDQGPPNSKVPFIGLEIELLLELWFKSESDLVASAVSEALEKANIAVFHIRPYRLL